MIVRRQVSEATRARMREAHLGKKHTAATRRKMSESQRKRGSATAETRAKISTANKGQTRPSVAGSRHPSAKPVNQLTLDGQFVRRWDYMAQTREDPRFRATRYISECCRGMRKSYAGYRWEFAEDEQKAP